MSQQAITRDRVTQNEVVLVVLQSGMSAQLRGVKKSCRMSNLAGGRCRQRSVYIAKFFMPTIQEPKF